MIAGTSFFGIRRRKNESRLDSVHDLVFTSESKFLEPEFQQLWVFVRLSQLLFALCLNHNRARHNGHRAAPFGSSRSASDAAIQTGKRHCVLRSFVKLLVFAAAVVQL